MDDESWIKISDISYRHYSQPLYANKVKNVWCMQSNCKTPPDIYGPFDSLIEAIIFGNKFIKTKVIL